MSDSPVSLIPLVCVDCRQPIKAQPDEVAWVCSTCHKGNILGDDGRLRSLDVKYAANLGQNSPGRPHWAVIGTVTIRVRNTYKGNESRDSSAFWAEPRLFLIPAFAAPLEVQVAQAMQWLRSTPPAVVDDQLASLLPVVIPARDIHPMAEFIVLAIEADRRDAMKTLDFQVDLQVPQLWILE